MHFFTIEKSCTSHTRLISKGLKYHKWHNTLRIRLYHKSTILYLGVNGSAQRLKLIISCNQILCQKSNARAQEIINSSQALLRLFLTSQNKMANQCVIKVNTNCRHKLYYVRLPHRILSTCRSKHAPVFCQAYNPVKKKVKIERDYEQWAWKFGVPFVMYKC